MRDPRACSDIPKVMLFRAARLNFDDKGLGSQMAGLSFVCLPGLLFSVYNSVAKFYVKQGCKFHQDRMKPKILLVTTCRWFSAARLAIAFAEIGWAVEMVGPRGHPATKTKALQRRYAFRGLAPTASILAAIRRAQPDLIIPCDDLSTIFLHRLCLELLQKGEDRLAVILQRTLGPPASFPTIDSRTSLMEVARSEQVRTPETAVVNRQSLPAWLAKNGLPAVLKADGSAGGRGVQVVRTIAMAEQAVAELSAPPMAARAIKRALFDQDRTLLKPSMQRHSPVVNAQVLLPGSDATISVACWEGRVVASITFEVIRAETLAGPSSVLRLIDHPEMSSCAEKLVKRLGLSGLYGFDFILEEQNNRATLIEMNARATQTCHLAMGTRHDLPAALAAMVDGKPVPPTQPVSDRKVIALFPQEWQSNPASEYFATAYHDVPWGEPALVKACIDRYVSQRKWYSLRRLVASYRKFSNSSSARDSVQPVGRP
jgi:formate-dependent phosphoribosylglycinamide formyltransferase (GAR transformylase)